MEIGNQYVNCANLKNRREIREDGNPQIQTKKTHTHTHKRVSFDKREKKKSENMELQKKYRRVEGLKQFAEYLV